jgi:HK97 family phage major capsid protein
MTLEELTARLTAISERGRQILAEAGDAPLSEEATAEIDALDAEKSEIERQIRDHNARLRAQRLQDSCIRGEVAESGVRRMSPVASNRPRIEVGREGFERDPMCGYRSPAEFLREVRAVATGQTTIERSRRLLPLFGGIEHAENRLELYGISSSEFARESVGGEGGFLVPPQMREEIFSAINGTTSLFNVLYKEPISTNAVEWDGDETTPWGASGIRPYWLGEGGSLTATKPNVEKRINRLHKVGALVNVTEELNSDATRLNNVITRQAGAALDYVISEGFYSGDGIAKPVGFFGHSSQVTVAKETGQAAGTINAANVTKMLARRRTSNDAQWVWLMSASAYSQIITLTIGSSPAWTSPASGLKDAPGGMLLGIPIVISEHCSTLGTEGDIVLVNARGYYGIYHSTSLRFDSSIHVHFAQDISAFRWIMRVGGMPFLQNPVSPKNGSLTYSDFIALQTRS